MKRLTTIAEDVVSLFVNQPEEVEAEREETTDDDGEELTVIKVHVADEDVGLCIGKKGATAKALRRIVGLTGMQRGKDVLLKIDTEKNEDEEQDRFEKKYKQIEQ